MNPPPNILFLITDQQSATMLSCTGNRWLQTPAMDRLAARGIRFERAYCTNPMCVPSRFSLFTGRMAGEVGVRGGVPPIERGRRQPKPEIPDEYRRNGLGWPLRQAGYDCLYGGKVHLPGKIHPTEIGFDVFETDQRDRLATTTANLLREYASGHDRPFFAVASFINPHDICYHALRDFAESDFERLLVKKGRTEISELEAALRLPPGISREDFLAHHCPPLPGNFEIPPHEPAAFSELGKMSPFRRKARELWSHDDWRMHRWAFARLTERVDGQIGTILDALDETGLAANTLVVLTSDHGDLDAAHRLEHKDCPYEEACRIPFIVAGPDVARGEVDETHLVSNGLDLFPTLCDYAGATPPTGLTGKSLRPLLEGRPPESWRRSLPLESVIGDAIIGQRYKFAAFDYPQAEEWLIDRETDPGEMRNLAESPEHAGIADEMRAAFRSEFHKP